MDDAAPANPLAPIPCRPGLPRARPCRPQAAAALPPIDLDDALGRFGREAVRGVCDTGRYRMPYFVWGEGRPLAFVHGVMDSSRAWVMTALASVGPFPPRGLRRPPAAATVPARRHSHADLVRDFWALLDHLGLFAQPRPRFLLRCDGRPGGDGQRPERLPRAILQAGLALRPLRRLGRFLRGGRWILPGTAARLPLCEKVTLKVNGPGFREKPETLYRYFVETTGGAGEGVAHQALRLDRVDLRPLLPEVKQPVLLFCGDLDIVVRPVHAEILLGGLPNARRVVVEGCGHVPGYSHPEVLAEVVRAVPDAAGGVRTGKHEMKIGRYARLGLLLGCVFDYTAGYRAASFRTVVMFRIVEGVATVFATTGQETIESVVLPRQSQYNSRPCTRKSSTAVRKDSSFRSAASPGASRRKPTWSVWPDASISSETKGRKAAIAASSVGVRTNVSTG